MRGRAKREGELEERLAPHLCCGGINYADEESRDWGVGWGVVIRTHKGVCSVARMSQSKVPK